MEADRETAEGILRGGGVLIDFPGGDFDVFRPWRDRNHIDFNGRLGFIRLALRTGVPVVPAVSIGAHETVVVLARGERLARTLGIDRLFRIKVMPLVLGPPWGVVPGGIPTLPLPAKITVELGDPSTGRRSSGPRRPTTRRSSGAATASSPKRCRPPSTGWPPSAATRSSASAGGTQIPGRHPGRLTDRPGPGGPAATGRSSSRAACSSSTISQGSGRLAGQPSTETPRSST